MLVRRSAWRAVSAAIVGLVAFALAGAAPASASPVGASPVGASPVDASPVGASLVDVRAGDAPSAASLALASSADDDPTAPDSTASPDSTAAFDAGHAPFVVRFAEEVIPYRVMGVFVTPGAEVPLDVLHGVPGATYDVRVQAGSLAPLTNRSWRWYAPATPGLYRITVTDAASGRAMRLNAFVLTPFEHDRSTLDGYRIGRYRAAALHRSDVYARPDGFVRVTPDTKGVRVSPHFTLGQFLCKQTDALPQFALVRTRLLLKLERLLAAVNARGVRVSTLHVMSGFRTPYYNRAIGNTTDYSRHLYGGAADVFVDADGNGVMDDVDGDGRISRADAEWLADVVRALSDADGYDRLVGGLGVYGPAPHRGPFVHVDARGTPARW